MAESVAAEPNVETGKCAVCDKESRTRCAACSGVFYCSAEHQKEDWKKHKPICKAWKVRI